MANVEVYQDAVPDGNGCRPLPYLRGVTHETEFVEEAVL
jgi:hypothetical protein